MQPGMPAEHSDLPSPIKVYCFRVFCFPVLASISVRDLCRHLFCCTSTIILFLGSRMIPIILFLGSHLILLMMTLLPCTDRGKLETVECFPCFGPWGCCRLQFSRRNLRVATTSQIDSRGEYWPQTAVVGGGALWQYVPEAYTPGKFPVPDFLLLPDSTDLRVVAYSTEGWGRPGRRRSPIHPALNPPASLNEPSLSLNRDENRQMERYSLLATAGGHSSESNSVTAASVPAACSLHNFTSCCAACSQCLSPQVGARR